MGEGGESERTRGSGRERSEGRKERGGGRKEKSLQRTAGCGSQGCGSRWGRNCCPGKLEGKAERGGKERAKRGAGGGAVVERWWREERRKETGRQRVGERRD